MSDQNLAAAIMMAAVLAKTELPAGADVDKEALRLFRRYNAILGRAAAKTDKGSAAGDSQTGEPRQGELEAD